MDEGTRADHPVLFALHVLLLLVYGTLCLLLVHPPLIDLLALVAPKPVLDFAESYRFGYFLDGLLVFTAVVLFTTLWWQGYIRPCRRRWFYRVAALLLVPAWTGLAVLQAIFSPLWGSGFGF